MGGSTVGRKLLALALMLLVAAAPMATAKGEDKKHKPEKDHEKDRDGNGREHEKKRDHEDDEAPASEPPSPAPPPANEAPHAAPPTASQPPTVTLAPAPPTPEEEWRAANRDRPLRAEGRTTILRPNAPSPTDESSAAITGPAPWAWALPLVGLVSLGAMLLRPREELRPTTARTRFTFAGVDPDEMLRAGQDALKRGALDEAIAWFQHAAALAPRLAIAHFCQGVCAAALERHEDAYAALKRAYALDTTDGVVRVELSRAAARTGRTKEAMDVLSPVLAALPRLADEAADDEAFAGLRDHPRFLVMTGRL